MRRTDPIEDRAAGRAAFAQRAGRLHAGLCEHLAHLARAAPPGEVHDVRVAARRLRTTQKSLKPGLGRGLRRRYAHDLRRIVHILAPVREADVRRGLLRSMLAEAELGDARKSVHALLTFAAGQRNRVRRELRGVLAGDGWRRLRSRFEDPAGVRALTAAALLADPACLSRRIHRRHRRLEKRMRRSKHSARWLHRLRLDIKDLRYSYEDLATLRPRNPGMEIVALRSLQSGLGELHDLWLLGKWLRREAPRTQTTRALADAARKRARHLRRQLQAGLRA